MSASEVQVSDEVKKPDKILNMRHTMALLLFLATTISYANRVSMSVAIVSMTQVNSTTNHQMFDWDRATKDKILSSFFWGYIVLQVPAGMIAGRFGGKILIFIAMLSTGLINLLIPLAAVKGGWVAVCACRVGMGLTQGLLFPSIHGLLGQWVPATERSRTGTFVYAGSQLGTILELAAAGALSESKWGWPSIFYSVGICCIVYTAVWCIFGSSSPSYSRWISKEERKYIETNTASTELSEIKKVPTPWKSIWTSMPFWAILIAHFGQNLGFWTLLTEMPSYMESVLKVEIKTNGQLSALPYIAMYLLSFVFSWTADKLVNKNILSIGWTRRILNTIAFWGPGVALLLLSYVPAGHLALSVALLTITVGLNGAHFVGFMMSHIDLSPNFSSTLMGITNGIGNISSIIAPLTVSMIIKDESSASEWRKVFFISIGFYFLTNLFYLLFISGNVQSWNDPITTSNLEDDVEKQKDKETKNDQKIYQDTDKHF